MNRFENLRFAQFVDTSENSSNRFMCPSETLRKVLCLESFLQWPKASRYTVAGLSQLRFFQQNRSRPLITGFSHGISYYFATKFMGFRLVFSQSIQLELLNSTSCPTELGFTLVLLVASSFFEV